MREDRGEVELAREHRLPIPVTIADIRGDLHIHSDFDLHSSHDVGISPLSVLLEKAQERQYEYIGLSDHNPKTSGLSTSEIINVMKARKEYFEHELYGNKLLQKFKSVKKVFTMLEVDIRPTGELALPEKAFEYVDAVLVSIHSSFTQDKRAMTERILGGLSFHPKVKVFAHPTGRLIESRNSIDADWDAIFDYCKAHNIALEINSSPNRLDLPDPLVWEARRQGLAFVIGTDAHAVQTMDDMEYGVSVARRGWCTKSDILTTLPFNEFNKWLVGGGDRTL
jgi:DNA polymerase (family X)